MGRIQRGYIYEASGCFYVRYWTTEIVDGRAERVQRSEKLCEKSDKHYARNAKAVKLLRDDFMHKHNQESASNRAVNHAVDMPVADFWEKVYLPHCEAVVMGNPRKKPSTVRGYKQIWNQHLKDHFGSMTLKEYEPSTGTRFLDGLTATQNKNTLRHIKALGCSIFKRAVNEQRVKVNPWHDVQMPDDAVDGASTQHYTWEEAENIISALVDHVECQLIVALACFMGLRPGEIEGLKWEDFDPEWLHIRRSVVRGMEGTPKTEESIASIPLWTDAVRVPLELWRQKNGNPTEGWLFPTEAKTPAALNNFINRMIKPTLKKEGIAWRRGGLYCGRRGAATEVIEKTGNVALAQALLRHKNMGTTLTFYKKRISDRAFLTGMKSLQAAK
jgi:integrase